MTDSKKLDSGKARMYLDNSKTEFGDEIQLIDYITMDKENVSSKGTTSIGGYQSKKMSETLQNIFK